MSTTNITFVLAVLNKLDLTENCYSRIREIYPTVPFVISSGGSTDGTKEWLVSMAEKDANLTIFHDDDRLAFSETYNSGIKLNPSKNPTSSNIFLYPLIKNTAPSYKSSSFLCSSTY